MNYPFKIRLVFIIVAITVRTNRSNFSIVILSMKIDRACFSKLKKGDKKMVFIVNNWYTEVVPESIKYGN